MNNKIFKMISILILSFIAIPVFFIIKFPGNKARTSPVHKDEKLRQRRYKVEKGISHFLKEIENLVPQITTYGKKWKVTSSWHKENDLWVLKTEVPVFIFIDGMEIYVQEAEKPGEVLVDAFSSSRKGKSDLGENRRHIIEFFKELERNCQVEPMD